MSKPKQQPEEPRDDFTRSKAKSLLKFHLVYNANKYGKYQMIFPGKKIIRNELLIGFLFSVSFGTHTANFKVFRRGGVYTNYKKDE